MINIGVLVSGRGTNLQAIIEAVEEGRIEGEISIVVSDNPDAYALKRAKQYNIETQYIDFNKFKNRENYDKKIEEYLKRQAVEYGVKVSGCTVHFVDEGVDSGPIILQKAVKVSDDDAEESLAKKILKEEHQIYPQAIQLFSEGRLIIKGRKVFIKKRSI